VVALAGAAAADEPRLHSRQMLGLVDWELLVLFIGLFVVNHALQKTGVPTRLVADLAAAGCHCSTRPVFATTSYCQMSSPSARGNAAAAPWNTRWLPRWPGEQLAGNLFIVGSVANIIVVDVAARHGIKIGWREHARIGTVHSQRWRSSLSTWLSVGWT